MRKTRRKLRILVTSMIFAMLFIFNSINALANEKTDIEKETDINEISFTARYSIVKDKVKVKITKLKNHCKVDHWEWTNIPPNGKLSEGFRPQVSVYLEAKSDNYSLSYSPKITVTDGKLLSARREGSLLKLDLELSPITETIGNPSSVRWVNSIFANWLEVDYALTYDVALFKDNKEVTKINTTDTFYDFGKDMKEPGTYYYQVRANSNTKSGEWISSKEMVVLQLSSPIKEGEGYWVKDGSDWRYKTAEGNYLANTWKQIDMIWYYFNSEECVTKGWEEINGNWYYFNGFGAMTTDWLKDDNGKWYYLGYDGAMLRDVKTPDGYKVDKNGAWIE